MAGYGRKMCWTSWGGLAPTGSTSNQARPGRPQPRKSGSSATRVWSRPITWRGAGPPRGAGGFVEEGLGLAPVDGSEGHVAQRPKAGWGPGGLAAREEAGVEAPRGVGLGAPAGHPAVEDQRV